MTLTLLLACRALQLLAAVFAVALWRRAPEHRPVAVLLVGGTLANTARVALQTLVIVPAIQALGGDPVHGIAPTEPLTGWARAAAHCDHSLQLGWSAGVAFAALWVLGEAKERLVQLKVSERIWVLWAGMTAFFAWTYPETRELHRQGYLIADLLAVTTGAVAFVRWARAGKGEFTATKKCMLMILAFDGLALLGPYLAVNYFASWDKATFVYAVLYGALSIVEGGMLWKSRTSE